MLNKPFELTPEAKALAQAALDGDVFAVHVLTDWVVEQRQREVGRYSVAYVEYLENTINEIKRLLKTRPNHKITDKALNRIYYLCFNAERYAKAVAGRNW